MRRKALALALATVMVAGCVTGCGSSSEDTTSTTDSATSDETAAADDAADDTEEATTEEAAADDSASDVDYGSGDVKVWVADAVVDFTNEQIKAFQDAHPEFSGYTFTVEAVGEGDAASNMITDVTAGADVYTFAQDQLTRLVAAGALETVEESNAEEIKATNDAGSVAAASVGDTLYAYPITSDNGYFLYYDSSVVSDPSTVEGILEDCAAAGKSFYFQVDSGWYNVAFFFATGATITYDTDTDGNFTACNCNYASEEGLKAYKALIALAENSAFINGSSLNDATNVGAIVDGTWDSETAQTLFGDNYACAKLPTFNVDGTDYQMSGFSGNKMLGVKPQEDENKLAVCDALAAYLSSEEVQLARFEAVGWGPSNLNAQADEAVQSNPALAALAEQMEFMVPQGNYPNDYWSAAEAFGQSITNGEVTSSTSDDDLMANLEQLQSDFESYVQ